MFRVLVTLLAAVPLIAATDPWAKVRDLKTGTEIRIIKTGAHQAILANFDEVTDDNLIVVVKKEQVAIPRDQVERIDARPPQTEGRLKHEGRSEVKDPQAPRGMPNESRTPTTSTSSGLNVGSKPDFETVYRKLAGAHPVPAHEEK